jgi:hypothetical protein
MSARKSLSKSVRFEVFKRDSFACQYCGRKAPEVVLHVDHIHPVAEGGTDDVLNLITSCIDCNLGKGARLLDDSSVVEKQRAQLEQLQERREQLEMMVEWQRGLINLEVDATGMAVDLWREITGTGLNSYGHVELSKWVKRWGLGLVLGAMRTATAQKLVSDQNGGFTGDSKTEAFHFIPRVAAVDELQQREPLSRDAYYVRGILKKRFDNVDPEEAKSLLIRSLRLGSTVDNERDWAKRAKSYWAWKVEMCRLISEWEKEDGPK